MRDALAGANRSEMPVSELENASKYKIFHRLGTRRGLLRVASNLRVSAGDTGFEPVTFCL